MSREFKFVVTVTTSHDVDTDLVRSTIVESFDGKALKRWAYDKQGRFDELHVRIAVDDAPEATGDVGEKP